MVKLASSYFLYLCLLSLLIFGGDCLAQRHEAVGEEHGNRSYAQMAEDFILQAESAQRSKEGEQAIRAWINAASCLKMTGNLGLGEVCLQRAEALLSPDTPQVLRLEFLLGQGSMLAQAQHVEKALEPLAEARNLAESLGDNQALVEALNDTGVALSSLGRLREALDSFRSAEVLAAKMGNGRMRLSTRQNHLIAAFQRWETTRSRIGQLEELHGWVAPEDTDAVDQAALGLRSSFDAMVSLARASRPETRSNGVFSAITAGMVAGRSDRTEASFSLLRWALHEARTMKDARLEKSALLALGELYVKAGRNQEVLELSDYLRSVKGPSDSVQVARIELLTAKARAALGPSDLATEKALRRAIDAVEPLRTDLARTEKISDLGRTFRHSAGEPYLQLANLLLSQSKPGAGVTNIEKAREAIERFKAWELEDFYRDDCVNLALAGKREISKVTDPEVAVLYVIPLLDRTEILLGTVSGLVSRQHPTSGEDLHRLARKFRFHLESDFGTARFIGEASALHQALIAPIAGVLRKSRVKHLVFVPDGALGNIPLAALYDEKADRFLVEDYSLSIAPSLSLIAGEALEERGEEPPVALLAGLSEAAGGLEPLPGAKKEIAAVAGSYRSPTVRLNREFTKHSFEEEMQKTPASIVHIASHAEFGGDLGGTFLQAHDERISLDDLEGMIRPRKYRGIPVELLCLSACQTAAGDDRSALGLAGAAVKSGARSVVATLWSIDDEATIEIMADFHRRLASPGAGLTKGRALRQAQLSALRKDPSLHPHFWAPFVLIGNWE